MLLQKLRKMKNKKGFTLVELIVVIAIIAVLAAVLVPMMGNYLTGAKVSSANASAATVRSTMMNFFKVGTGFPNSGSRKEGAPLASYLITINSGTVAVTTGGDSGNWTGDLATGTNLDDEIKKMFADTADCAILVTVKGNTLINVLYSEDPAVSGLASLIDVSGKANVASGGPIDPVHQTDASGNVIGVA